MQAQVATLLQKLGSGNLASLDELTLPANHVIAGGGAGSRAGQGG